MALASGGGHNAAVVAGVNAGVAAKEADQARRFAEANATLAANLARIGLKRRQQAGDGNCQFRAIAQQVFNSPHHHMLVRHMTVEYISRHPQRYTYLFDGPEEFGEYLETMRRSGSWGDEVTLHAAARWLGVQLHVVTSEKKRWRLSFAPEEGEEEEEKGKDEKRQQQQLPNANGFSHAASQSSQSSSVVLIDSHGNDMTEVMLRANSAGFPEDIRREQQSSRRRDNRRTGSQPGAPDGGGDGGGESDDESRGRGRRLLPHIFLAYLFPTHYDDVEVPPMHFAASPAAALINALRRVMAEEQEWIRVLDEDEAIDEQWERI
jgi:hypothetical protein